MKERPAILMLLLMSSLNSFCWNDNTSFAAVGVDMASSTIEEIEGDIQGMASDTHFVAMDLAYVQVGMMSGSTTSNEPQRQPRGVEPSPFMLWRNAVTQVYGVRIITLDPQSGTQRGNRLQVELLKSWKPVDVLWAQHFSTSPKRGIEPSPWIVCRDYRLYTFPVTYGLDGTPVAGTPATFLPVVDSAAYGHATCATELPGSEFADSKARLFVGTDRGYIVVLLTTFPGGIAVMNYLPISSVPIVSLQPLPQCGYIALGALTGNAIKGVRYYPNSPDLFALMFTLVDPRTPPIQDLDSFGPDDTVLPDCQSTLRLVLANSSTDLALASIEADQTGTASLTLTLDPHEMGVRSAVTGSLLMLASNELAVTFDPYYSQQSGSSGCDLNVTDMIADQCQYLCGDADANGFVNISDAVYLINYIFGGGPAPNPEAAGDADCNGFVNISDAVYLINYIFGGGAAPCASCK